MLNVFAKSFMTATRNAPGNHWGSRQRYDSRRDAELEAHFVARRRD